MGIADCGMRNEKRDVMQDEVCGNATPNSEHRTPHSEGFTLIEIVITIVLVGILAGLAAVIILQGVKSYSDEDFRSDVHYQTRIAAERMARELRSMQSCSTISVTSNPTGTISFFDVNTGATVTFIISGTDLFRKSATNDLLASNITSTRPFSFTNSLGTSLYTCSSPTPNLNIWYIHINLTDTKGTQSLPIYTRVHPRNF